MKQKLLTLFTLLLTVCSGAWADTVLFTTNFSTADGWDENTSLASGSKEINGTTVSFKDGGSVAAKPTSGTLTFGGNSNLTNTTSVANLDHYIAIPVTGVVAGTVTVTTVGGGTKFYYCYSDGSTSTCTSRAQGSTNDVITITGLTSNSVTIYIGSKSKSITKLTVTTPELIDISSSSFYSLYKESSSDVTAEALISDASLPSYISIKNCTNADNGSKNTSSVTSPHDFSAISSNKYYRLKPGTSSSIVIGALSHVKSIRVYGNGNGSTGNVVTAVSKIQGTGTTFTVGNQAFANSKTTIVEYSTGDLTKLPGYDADTYYQYNITFSATFSLWGVYVEYAAPATPSYTITLDDNGDYQGNGSATVKAGDATLTISSQASRIGYIVKGYYAEAGCETKIAEANGTLLANKTGFTDADGKWTATENKTLYADWEPAKYTLTVAPNQAGWGTVSPTSVENIPNGTATSNSDNTFSVNGTTVTATAADATAEYTYAFVEWTDLPATVTENATVTATFSRTANSYTLAWNTNGGSELAGEYTSGNTAYGTTLTAPTDPTRDGYIFNGWNTANDGSGDDYAGTMPAANTTYYAQWETTPNVYYYKDATHYDNGTFKNPEGGDAASSDNENLSTPWTIVNGSTITGVTSVVANGCQYDGKNNHINAYIKVPTGGDKDTKNVTFTIASGYTATISMKIGGYSANPTITLKPLEDNTLGDAVAYTGTVGGVATTENNFNKISWDVESGTYVLNVTSRNAYISQINIETEAIPTVPVTISAYGLATYASDNALNFGGVEGIKAYRATISENTITFTQVTEVPAGEGVLLKATTGEGVRNFDIPITTTDAWAADDNDFVRGTNEKVVTSDGTNYNYILSTKDGVLGFYNANGTVVAPNRAYLTTTEAPSAKGLTMIFADEEETTGIRSIENRELRSENYDYYNLSGQRVGKDYKGIVIVNGKKMLNK